MKTAAPTPCDLGRGDDAGLVLAATILASSLSFIDGSVINVGLPAISRAFDGGPVGLEWVIDAHLLPLSALLLLGGALGDRFGRRRVFALGTGLFGVASAICAAAPRLGILIAGCIVQGLGSAMLMPNSLAILSEAFQVPARGRAIGAWTAIGAAVAGLGSVLGGWLIDAVGCLGTALAASGEDLVRVGRRVAACAAAPCLLAAGSALVLPPTQTADRGGTP